MILVEGDTLRLNEVVQCPPGKASVNERFPVRGSNYHHPRAPYHRIAGGPEGTGWRVLYDSIVGVTDDFVALTWWAICVDA
jgi:hypothetical protein